MFETQEHPAGNSKIPHGALTTSLADNVALIKSVFADVDPIQYRWLAGEVRGALPRMCFIYSDGVVSSNIIDNHILKPLMQIDTPHAKINLIDYLCNHVIQINSIKKITDIEAMIASVSYGDSVLLVEGYAEAILLDTKGFVSRALAEPDGEKILSGPREGFSEILMQNLSLVRRKLRSSDLKMKYYNIGKRSNTALCVVYLDSLIKPEVLQELYRRLDSIEIDAVLDSNYITELIRDNRWSIFHSTGYTERPDVVAGKLLEGRIALFVDGTPVVITVPYLFIENFQSNEDYYLNFYYTSFSRIIRIFGFLLAIATPAFYVAVVAYHQEILPTPLIINIATESHNVPMPASIEAILLLIMFDILRETGIRMPLGVGQALSVVGALVVGSAAVEADLVTAPMIIVAAVSGITSLLIPKLNVATLLIRIGLLLLASALGFYGVVLGLAVLFTHMLSLESFGISQLTRDRTPTYQNMKDSFIRAPWWQMHTRPEILSQNKTRMRKKGENI